MSTVPDPWRFYTDLVMLFFQWFSRKVTFLSFMILVTFISVFQKKQGLKKSQNCEIKDNVFLNRFAC
jgi:hypothetical protein